MADRSGLFMLSGFATKGSRHVDIVAKISSRNLTEAFFTWLGVVPYLSRDAVLGTLSLIASIPDVEVVFEYGRSPATYPPERRAGYEAMIARAAASGEPWLSFFDPDELANALSQSKSIAGEIAAPLQMR